MPGGAASHLAADAPAAAHAAPPDATGRPGGRGAVAPPTVREAAAALGLLLLLGAAVYGVHVARGGFTWDDWQLAGRLRFAPQNDEFIGWIDLKLLAFRPLSAIFVGLPALAFGTAAAWHLALAVAISAATAATFYVFLRVVVPLEPVHAGAIAGLLLVFPWSDSMVLWPTASLNWLGVAFYFAGVVVAIRGLEAGGRRGTRLAAASVGLYLASLWSYEIAGPAILAGFLLYRRVAPRRTALRRWAVDAVLVSAWLVVVALNTQRDTQALGDTLAHGATILDEALTLAARALVPVDGIPRLAVLGGAAALLVCAFVLARRTDDAAAATRLRRWAWLAVAGLGALVVGYALVVPASDHYGPLRPGIENRINLLAAPAYVTFAYAAVMTAWALARTVLPGARHRPVAAIAAVAVAAIGAGYVSRVAGDIGDWDAAAAARERVLDALEAAVPRPPPSTTLYAYGEAAYQAPGVPIFAVTWDFRPAARLRYDDRTVGALTVRPGVRFTCMPGGVRLNDPAYRRTRGSDYGRSVLVDVRTGRTLRIDTPAACAAANAFLASAPAPPRLGRDG